MAVSEQIIQVLDALGEKFGIAIDWTSENIIPYIETLCSKYISYEVWTSVAWIGIMLLMSIASVVATKKLYPVFKRGLESQGSYDIDWTVGSVFAIIGLVGLNLATVIVVGVQTMDIIRSVTFPEMQIVEYAYRLINSTR